MSADNAVMYCDTGTLISQINSLKAEIARLRQELDANQDDMQKSIILEDKKCKLEKEQSFLEFYFGWIFRIWSG